MFIVEMIFVLAVMWGVWVFRYKKLKKRVIKISASDTNHSSIQPFIKRYIENEIKKATDRLHAIQTFDQSEFDDGATGEQKRLALRVGILGLEPHCVDHPQKDAFFWNSYLNRLQELLDEVGYTLHGMEAPTEATYGETIEIDEDEVDAKRLTQQIEKLIDEIAKYIWQEILGEKNTELKTKIDRLKRMLTELVQCMFILDDENQFLRNQIAALVKD